MVLLEENIVWYCWLLDCLCIVYTVNVVNCLFKSSPLVQAAELLILVHIEFNILAVEFMIVALLYLEKSLFIQQELLFW